MKIRHITAFLFLFLANFAVAQLPQALSSEYITLPGGKVARRSDVNLWGPTDFGKYPPAYYWGDTSLIDLKQKPLLFLTHHSSVYDPKGVAADGAKQAMDTFLGSNYPVFYLYSFRFAPHTSFRFLDYYGKFVGVESEGGENRLRYMGSRNYFFTGGHFSLCLCETIRDTLRNVTDASMNETTHFYFVNEGVYDIDRNLKTIATDYQKSGTGYEQLVKHKLVVNSGGGKNDWFCSQNWKNQPNIPVEDYSVEVVNYDGKVIPISQGTKGRYQFHLVDFSQLGEILETIN